MSAPDPTPVATATSGTLRISLRTAAILLVFTLFFTALMAMVHQATAPVIVATTLDAKRRLISEVLPPETYDNDLLADTIELPPLPALGLAEASTLYRARNNGQPVALVLEAVAPDGYSGQIRLLLAVRADGRIAALRAIAHKETPGLGDYIDPKKDRSKSGPWIAQFDSRGFADIPPGKWRVKKDGGHFEQRTGATITARAVTKASGRALKWTLTHAPALFALPQNATYEEKAP